MEENTLKLTKYSNRKVYCPELGRYVNTDELLRLVLDGRLIKIQHRGTGLDVTNETVRKAAAMHGKLIPSLQFVELLNRFAT